MNSSKFNDKILDLRPRYSDKYRPMIETISIKQERSGTGNVAQFGAYYQTFMYACIVGMRIGRPLYFETNEKSSEFAPLYKWKPTQIRDFIVMMLFNRSADFGYNWITLENANDETIGSFLRVFQREMEGYANRGFEYIQKKWDNERVLFGGATVFVDILKELKTE